MADLSFRIDPLKYLLYNSKLLINSLEKESKITASREVKVGDILIGGNNPVRIQTMTNTPTLDTAATVKQILKVSAAGAELVRMTVRSTREAENLAVIKKDLHVAGCFIPLVADVHFNPIIAETAAAIVDKVRINPGNYGIPAGKGSPALTSEEYRQELDAAKTAFSRLLKICRIHETALRIGVNHGSLSPRIINRYGNTPAGMVHSAMEFLQFCAEEEFHNVIVSLKSSNTRIMVQANRMMAAYMRKAGLAYPLHLGVTEAGEGEDGRIRSVAGIGTLLWEGIGDTIRISLTEDPEHEIPVARKLVEYIGSCLAGRSSNKENGAGYSGFIQSDLANRDFSTAAGFRRKTDQVANIGGEQVPVVVAGVTQSRDEPAGAPGDPSADFRFEPSSRPGYSGVLVPSVAYNPENPPGAEDQHRHHDPGKDIVLQATASGEAGRFPLITTSRYLQGNFPDKGILFLQVATAELSADVLQKASTCKQLVFVALSQSGCTPLEMRSFLQKLEENDCSNPVIFKKEYDIEDNEYFQIAAAADFAPLFIDGLGDGIWLVNRPAVKDHLSESTAFSILQSSRVRTSKTEFISCPSCGRTMFNIQKATTAVKRRTSHLKGLTIAVMGCIVNGPGEMADADYGYVGSGRGKVTLYRKHQVVKKNIPEENAVDELISLIRDSGDWTEA